MPVPDSMHDVVNFFDSGDGGALGGCVLAAIISKQDQLKIKCAHQASHWSLESLHPRRQKWPTVTRHHLRSSSLVTYKSDQTYQLN